MSVAQITITFSGAYVLTGPVYVQLSDCEIAVNSQGGVAMAMVPPPELLVVSSNGLVFETSMMARLEGSIVLAITWLDGSQPTVTLSNIQGLPSDQTATVTWPVAGGTRSGYLTSGNPVTLDGIA